MAVILAGEDVADVHLDGGGRDGGQGVVQRHACVAVAAGVDNDAVSLEAHLLYAVNQLALDVALEIAYLDVGEAVAQLFYVVGDARRAVGFGLASWKMSYCPSIRGKTPCPDTSFQQSQLSPLSL